jgi:hypothetical protein
MASRFVVVVRKCMFDLILRLHGVCVWSMSSRPFWSLSVLYVSWVESMGSFISSPASSRTLHHCMDKPPIDASRCYVICRVAVLPKVIFSRWRKSPFYPFWVDLYVLIRHQYWTVSTSLYKVSLFFSWFGATYAKQKFIIWWQDKRPFTLFSRLVFFTGGHRNFRLPQNLANLLDEIIQTNFEFEFF